MRHPSKIMITASALALALSVLAGQDDVRADSKKWRANNHTEYKIEVFWTAEGCAGIDYPCYYLDETLHYVCEAKTLNPGDEKEYEFPDGTSDRKKQVCNKDMNGTMVRTDERKKNEIYSDDTDKSKLHWVNE